LEESSQRKDGRRSQCESNAGVLSAFDGLPQKGKQRENKYTPSTLRLKTTQKERPSFDGFFIFNKL
jgi:hypothetical protein